MIDRYNYQRRKTIEVVVGNVTLGSGHPVALQSMTDTDTLDTEASAAQVLRIAEAGADIVRLTTQGPREAANMAEIRRAVRSAGSEVPLVADVHFNPKAALTAALYCEKVRINPGNFADPARTFRHIDYTDTEYEAERDRLREALLPFINRCKEAGTSVRLGVNHGSLSDRIMSRYGDTPEGMVESVMEYLRVFREENFDRIVISVKASNTVVMTRTVRLLVEAMDAESMAYPLHLGVTEAGDGEDARVKSAVGIGALLADGMGDTIRVSLSEPPENEIPVAKALRDYIVRREGHPHIDCTVSRPEGAERDNALSIPGFEKVNYPIVPGIDTDDRYPEGWYSVLASENPLDLPDDGKPVILTSRHQNPLGEIRAYIDTLRASGKRNPVILRFEYPGDDIDSLRLEASADLGALLLDGYGSGILIDAPDIPLEQLHNLELGILQATRLRMTKTEYIACPGCGRTLYDMQTTLHDIRRATEHLGNLKIGVMGCIVNGPGEMADADYGYVGVGKGKINLFRGKECVEKGIPQSEAIDHLIALIRHDGLWSDPAD